MPAQDPTAPTLILNVDDYEPGRYVRTRLLTESGYRVIEAGTGADALRLAHEHAPAMVLLDVHLPDISGVEVCRQLKSSEKLSDVVVLHLSASATTGPQQVQGLDSGADSYLVEPVEADVLMATVRSLLRVRKAESDLRNVNNALLASNQELARVNSALRISNDDLQRFSYIASHDLQEPLRTIVCFSDLLDKNYGEVLAGEGQASLKAVRNAAQRMGLLIRDLLTYAEASQDIHLPLKTCDLNEVLAWALENLKLLIEETGVRITHSRLPIVIVNPVQCTQLFQNLIGNALKYRDPLRPLELIIDYQRESGAFCRISFLDNGIGIAPEFHEQIFAPFKRLHGVDVPGTGIGLALCRRIVESHGGRIWVESPGEGAGSKFSLTLPVRKQP